VTAGEPSVRVLPDPEAVSREAAARIAAVLRAGVAARGRADWATTGGSTPVGIYRALEEPSLSASVPWDAVHVWWGDDRFVPRDHPLSNVQAFDQAFLGAAAIAGLSGTGEDLVSVELGAVRAVLMPPSNVHAMPMGLAIGEGRPAAWVAEAYAKELAASGLPTSDAGFPILDVILVGVGPDGHVLSVFPGSPLLASDAWVADVPAPTHVEPHVARVSLNPGMLGAARLPLVVAHGAGKAEILGKLLGPERDHERWPAQVARRAGAEWLLDEAAASQLPR
jgi:6-phosphogluconolactonase/glucosamine-6-phosphate isomerase/deaminase